MESASDAELVAMVLDGQTGRYEVLVRRYQETMYRHALGMVGDSDTAADLVQDSLVKAYSRLGTCDPDRFAAWLFRILRNRCKDWLKSRRRRDVSLTDQDVPASPAQDPLRELESGEAGRIILDALSQLPEGQREAFLMKHVEGRSYEEMAEMLGAGVSALKMRVMRARETLQALLGDRV
ncbi:MAG TPA: RNA polymerase sigma factor [Longimicrobium sp.]|uniref:RNA polymerase sigma factor n=1 Tax=Longimicrobium sp. TaxID=2029185 RepID=UPI002ED91BC9